MAYQKRAKYQFLNNVINKFNADIVCLCETWLMYITGLKLNVVDTSYEGILWLTEHRENPQVTFLVSVCYLPPSRSTRGDTSQEYFEKLGNQYSNLASVCKCGDLNARCGDHQDISNSEVYIPQRHVLDHATNSHGLQLLDFLRPLDSCMLNGRGKDTFIHFFTRVIIVLSPWRIMICSAVMR